jgi:long-chain fatty acid transport protein
VLARGRVEREVSVARRALGRAAFVLALAAPSSALASPQDVFGYGARATAMGATGAADAQGADATWGNVALLSLARARELTLGFEGAYLDLYARGGRLPGTMHPEPMRGTLIAGVLPIPFGGVLRDRVAFGFGFFTPTNVVVRGRVLYPETPQFSLLGDRMQSVTVQAGLGLDVGYGLRLGVGFSALAAIAGSVVVATDTSGNVGTKVDDQLVASYAKSFGASYDIGESYRVGVAYRSSLEARFSVTIEVHDLGTLVVPPFNIAGLAQYDPAQIAFEVARVKGPVRAAIGVTYKKWSKYPGAPEATVLCPPEHPDCKALVPTPPGYHDTLVPRAGAEIDLDRGKGYALRLRAGYFYEPSPVPAQTGEANGFDNARHVLTAGYGIELSEPIAPLRFDAFGQFHQLVPRTHVKDATVDPTNAGFPKAETGGHVIMVGLAMGVRF